MTGEKSASSLRGLVREILSSPQGMASANLAEGAEAHFRSAAELDYETALPKLFDHSQMHEIIDFFRGVLPLLNRTIFAITETNRLAEVAKDLGATLQLGHFGGRKGRSLRGFYIHDNKALKKPLICLNTANHPVYVAAAFWHELGHHLTNELFGYAASRLNLSFHADYHEHLADPVEAAADILMSLAPYPHAAAKRLFAGAKKRLAARNVDALVSRVVPHVRTNTGFDFESRYTPTENFRYLAGMIHLAKLRSALINQYEI